MYEIGTVVLSIEILPILSYQQNKSFVNNWFLKQYQATVITKKQSSFSPVIRISTKTISEKVNYSTVPAMRST